MTSLTCSLLNLAISVVLWGEDITHDDVVRWEVRFLTDVLRPGYLLLATVHFAIWIIFKVYYQRTGRRQTSRHRAMGRFIIVKGTMWLFFWLQNHFDHSPEYDPNVWWLTGLCLVIVAVFATAIDLLVRLAWYYIVQPVREWRRTGQRKPIFLDKDGPV